MSSANDHSIAKADVSVAAVKKSYKMIVMLSNILLR